MAASTVSIPTDRRHAAQFSFPLTAIKSLIGTLAALNASDQLVAATDAAARRVVGIFAEEVDNSAGSAGDLNAAVDLGCFKLTNGSNALTDAHIGRVCYVEDNQTVGSSGGTNAVVAGIVAKVDTNGVWVLVGAGIAGVPALAPVTVALTSTNGTAAGAADLAALKAEAEKIGDDVRAIHAALKSFGLLVG
jgi:hypothetical protein